MERNCKLRCLKLSVSADICVIPPPMKGLMLESMPLHAAKIAGMVTNDPILACFLNWVWKGWPTD